MRETPRTRPPAFSSDPSKSDPGELTVVSPNSPLGQALLGRVAGDTVEYAAPGGTLKVEIVSVGS